MPWQPKDATRHTWRNVANSALKSGSSEGSAVRQANAVVAKSGRKK